MILSGHLYLSITENEAHFLAMEKIHNSRESDKWVTRLNSFSITSDSITLCDRCVEAELPAWVIILLQTLQATLAPRLVSVP